MNIRILWFMAIMAAVSGPARVSADPIVLYGFGFSEGHYPYSGVTLDSQGNIYGTTTAGGSGGYGTVYEINASTHSFSTLLSFNGTNGSTPYGGLVFDSQGNCYGTTSAGGSSGEGTVFKINGQTGATSTVATFTGSNGATPYGALSIDKQGNIYGTTTAGGSSSDGTVFRIDTSGNFTTLVNFNGTNGSTPYAGVTVDSKGNLYGTTSTGGGGLGTVYKITGTTLSTVASFSYTTAYTAGGNPYGGVTIDAQGNLYGTSTFGGTGTLGTVWTIAAGGSTITPLANFGASGAGAYPYAGLVMDGQGNLYGTTTEGGIGGGTVFSVNSQTGAITYLTDFPNALVTGDTPEGGLALDSAGDIIGTAEFWGPNYEGTVFEIAAVPEPGALVLAFSAISAFAATHLRRRRAEKSQYSSQ